MQLFSADVQRTLLLADQMNQSKGENAPEVTLWLMRTSPYMILGPSQTIDIGLCRTQLESNQRFFSVESPKNILKKRFTLFYHLHFLSQVSGPTLAKISLQNYLTAGLKLKLTASSRPCKQQLTDNFNSRSTYWLVLELSTTLHCLISRCSFLDCPKALSSENLLAKMVEVWQSILETGDRSWQEDLNSRSAYWNFKIVVRDQEANKLSNKG